MLARTRLMPIHQPLEEFLIEHSRLYQVGLQHCTPNGLTQGSSEPVCQRNRESHFRPIQDVVGKKPPHAFLEHVFTFAVPKFELWCDPGDPTEIHCVEHLASAG